MASGFPRDYNWHLVIIKFGVGRLGMRRFRFEGFFVCLFVSLSLNRLEVLQFSEVEAPR